MNFYSDSSEKTIELGRKIASLLHKGDLITLKGDLAGGKTTFTKGIGAYFNVKGVVNSPTFTILKIYQGDLPLYHIDAYRLKDNDYDLGFEEYYDEGIMVIEWPEYYPDLPKASLDLNFTFVDDFTREITITARGQHYEEILKELSELC